MTRDEIIQLWSNPNLIHDSKFALARQYMKIRNIAAQEYLKTRDPVDRSHLEKEMDACSERIAKLFDLIIEGTGE